MIWTYYGINQRTDLERITGNIRFRSEVPDNVVQRFNKVKCLIHDSFERWEYLDLNQGVRTLETVTFRNQGVRTLETVTFSAQRESCENKNDNPHYQGCLFMIDEDKFENIRIS